MVVFGQKWLYSGKSFFLRKNGCIQVKVFILGKQLLFSCKVVAFKQK